MKNLFLLPILFLACSSIPLNQPYPNNTIIDKPSNCPTPKSFIVMPPDRAMKCDNLAQEFGRASLFKTCVENMDFSPKNDSCEIFYYSVCVNDEELEKNGSALVQTKCKWDPEMDLYTCHQILDVRAVNHVSICWDEYDFISEPEMPINQ